MYSLLSQQWLPARRASGCLETIRPADLTSDLGRDPIVAIDWPRPDFRAAALEFLIGLLATACPPAEHSDWLAWWREPPSPEALEVAFAPLANAFVLDGDGPRFMQDHEELAGAPDLPETLLIEAPGEAGRRNNTALLVKPDRVRNLSRGAAAMALFTLQTYAPAGGRGNLTSVRGGGPLTTLAFPGAPEPGGHVSLWHLLWANVPYGEAPAPDQLATVFPWLAPTRTADRFPKTVPGPDAHPLQAFWGIPRRIRLEFAPNPERMACDLSGAVDEVIVTGWRQRPNGVKYVGWEHPLTPTYQGAKDSGWLPVHPQPGGIGYRHWAALVVGDASRRPAACVPEWRERRGHPDDVGDETAAHTRLFAAGFDMDNMKARAFVESEMPLPGDGDVTARAERAKRLIGGADQAARALRMAVRLARYGEDASVDAGPMATVFEAFWEATQARFFALLASDEPYEPETVGRDWLRTLRATALSLFDEAAPLDPDATSSDPARVVRERRHLGMALAGFGTFGKKLFAELELPEAEPRKKGRAAGKEIA